MTKINRIKLAEWHSKEDNIDVDWPKIQKMLGVEQVEWLLKQNKEQCQLVVDKLNYEFALVAEFYDEKILTCYHLMWAK